MPNAIRVLEAFVFDDAGSRFFDAIQDCAERPRFRVDDRIVTESVKFHARSAIKQKPTMATYISGLSQKYLELVAVRNYSATAAKTPNLRLKETTP